MSPDGDGRTDLVPGPIHGELLGAERLAERARALAQSQQLAPAAVRRRDAPLLDRLTSTRSILGDVQAQLTAAVTAGIDPGPAGDWFLDNYYVVQEHLREVRESLPRGYYRELPELTGGPLSGYPRVYELATTLISHTEARVDLDNTDLFVSAFQEAVPLTIGELWAVPAMLRLALLESVRRMALRTSQRLEQIENADRWAVRIGDASRAGGAELNGELRAFMADPPNLTSHFIERFLQQLRRARGAFPALVALESWIADEALSAEEASARSNQRLAATQVAMANGITSLRAVARMDWPVFVERQSRMEAVLRTDPAGFYGRMTFETRDSYRHVVERIARRVGCGEEDVAAAAVALAAAADVPDADVRRRHVGYYLVDHGIRALERETGFRTRPEEAVRRWILRHPDLVLVGGIAGATVVALLALLGAIGPEGREAWLAVLLLGLIPASELAVSTLNLLIARLLAPGHLPKLELRRDGVPPEYRTAVVVPTLFASVTDVEEALENLEVQFLANRGDNLHFAVLSDFVDAPAETVEGDEAIVAAAVAGVRALNERYGGGEQTFHLLHRARRWNDAEGVWMGWERKRGKLSEFNRFIRGEARDAFAVTVGDAAVLRDIRYVITLDSDTVLPPEAAHLLIGTLAHPLNRAVYDAARGRVTGGYGILQPRVGVSLPSAYRSRFAAIFSGQPGVDPYTTAVSDVYQDLYREGSFTGKGIYDVDAFEAATRDRFPENALLSHDLIEGSYARAGLATDITVYDDFPSRYLTYSRRKHRWIRGDWQLIGWLRSHVRGPHGTQRNTLAVLSRWKIFDNLRRSTVEIAQVAFFIAGWLFLPGSPLLWTALVIGAIAAPWILSLLFAVLDPPFDRSWRAYYAAVLHDAATSAQQVGLAVAFLAHQAWVSADAIVRTLWRLFVSRRKLLEWQTFSGTERILADSQALTWRMMLPSVLLGLALVAVVGVEVLRGLETAAAPSAGPPRLWLLAAALIPVAALWIAAPGIAAVLNLPPVRRQRTVPSGRRPQALRYALLHWRYFERFVTAETSWLAPDNFQEEPTPVVAMRTSPTNIGLQLLATVSACDLGFITQADMLDRLESTFATLARLARFRGHFYNWYDLHDLHVLEPAYVSTVDSGNLAGHLIALRQACLAIPDTGGDDRRVPRAVRSALDLAAQRLAAASRDVLRPEDVRRLAEAGGLIDDAVAGLTSMRLADGGFAHVSGLVRRAHEAVLATGIEPDEAAGIVEWLAWTVNRIDAEVEERALPANARERLEALAERAYAYALEMDFGFLFDRTRKLFSIGYDQATHSLEPSYYDLLASEARLASFVAIAKNDVEVDHWFRLGRSLTHATGATALVSWSGSMFEYLMPLLVMRSFPLTLLDQTMTGAVRRHAEYGAEREVPWGVSESAYNLRDRHMTYQYRAFGVPDLALKRGLAGDLVVAPYATALALMVDTAPALDNMVSLERAGALGPYGFRDAIDFTRPDPGKRCAIVCTYMAHHIGMSFVALTNVLRGGVWQNRFHTDSLVRAAELLLYERVPRRVVLQAPQTTLPDETRAEPALDEPTVREFEETDTPRPHVALLGYPPYTLMLSHCGGGYSSYGAEGRAVTRWRADGTADDTGQFCYIKDLTAERAWSATHQPMCAPADWYRVHFAADRAVFQRADGAVETRTEIVVVPQDAAEVRRVTVTNAGASPREVEVTSYGEVVLSSAEADRAHPAFSKLFVETEFHAWCSAVTATRRPRSAHEPRVWCVHVLASGKERVGEVSCETDRALFLGRGRSAREPVALERDGELSGTTGAVLDPIFSLRARLRLEPGQSASVAFTTLIAPTRERAFELADRYHDPHTAQRALDLAWTSAQVELRETGITSADAAVFQELAGHLIYPTGQPLRAPESELRRNSGSQPLLWENGISGDLPILLATIESLEGLPTLQELFAAHHFWRRHGLRADLVVLNAHRTAYFQELNDQILVALSAASGTGITDVPGGVHVRRRQTVSSESRLMLEATAAVHVVCDGSSIATIIEAAARPAGPPVGATARRVFPTASRPEPPPAEAPEQSPLLFDNTFGGLDEEGDYEVRVRGDQVPPAPWSNVIANPHGGFVITERGGGFTWAGNSYFFRLTPWRNDPVSDAPGDVLYLQDPERDVLWSATPAPVRSALPYRVRHGAGTTTFEHERAAIATRLTLGMAEDEPAKIALLEVTNRDTRARRIRVTAYVEWTLGVTRERTQHTVHTAFDAVHNAILARNHFDPQFAAWTAYCALSEPLTGHTADRREFLGRNGTAAAPAALARGRLAGRTGAGVDPCAVLQCALELAPGETRTVVVLLGAARDETEARAAIAKLRAPADAETALSAAVGRWRDRLDVLRVRTPEPSFDAILNRWSLYQALACRMWGRSALYQSSGAYGFRDQLQDVMAFVYAEPGIAREHILRAAARQFTRGDVQHWWHPQSGRGVRTRFSDDLAWLPFVVEHYVRVTGDATVLDEVVPFLEMRDLAPEEHEVYELPSVAAESATVYEHCARALRLACTTGEHGLPLIGAGDWNDGMNRVGVRGHGESVWLAWFLIATLRRFGALAHTRGNTAAYDEMQRQADAYVAAVEAHGWDGDWYRRAYFDDGTPLGSATGSECRIDAIAQSWSVISESADPDRQARALRAVEEHLVREDARLIMLLTPPFDHAPTDPGYIKGYVPGVRENGAQYTHAALWTVLSTALRGDGERAFSLYQMINPLEHARTPADVNTYKVEPYVVAADVYTAEGQLGRGGWTWYTGSASWMYRVGLEALLGFTKVGDTLTIDPRVPDSWPGYTIEYRFGRSLYAITVENPAAIARDGALISLDGAVLRSAVIPLIDDGARHDVIVSARPAPADLRRREHHRRPRS